jgi:hypothetical protein
MNNKLEFRDNGSVHFGIVNIGRIITYTSKTPIEFEYLSYAPSKIPHMTSNSLGELKIKIQKHI